MECAVPETDRTSMLSVEHRGLPEGDGGLLTSPSVPDSSTIGERAIEESLVTNSEAELKPKRKDSKIFKLRKLVVPKARSSDEGEGRGGLGIKLFGRSKPEGMSERETSSKEVRSSLSRVFHSVSHSSTLSRVWSSLTPSSTTVNREEETAEDAAGSTKTLGRMFSRRSGGSSSGGVVEKETQKGGRGLTEQQDSLSSESKTRTLGRRISSSVRGAFTKQS